ncbi:MAG: 2-amino-4-hydroxy-6-hydroxymethyldihydropteridine diphosphokinase [Litorilituus sp.]|jgi:2-amino-4-hydroxy-6-hydroxymethyldihydropteridine diphosphokinase|nr:2-amino-4-hydroxy-6-hydroxymethyldihydropteridine diphosphokinase [Litorilituus sp.]
MAQIYISLGSNIEREYHVKHGLKALAEAFELPFDALSLSSLFKSEAVGFDGVAFYNMVIGIKTPFSVVKVTTILRDIEVRFGRSPQAKKFSPRTLDLDLLLYDTLITNSPAQLPRDEIIKNAFVLWPLSEIAAKLTHPICHNSYENLWQNYDKSSQALVMINKCW